ncbi:unnamed protein product [Clavelina lepadiformis]|uniref:C2H2-type domain-containing protein n=1 Tax=Clavelina lepadiformis TaxID=159417 RepID=A0ABP0G2F5_CLALP
MYILNKLKMSFKLNKNKASETEIILQEIRSMRKEMRIEIKRLSAQISELSTSITEGVVFEEDSLVEEDASSLLENGQGPHEKHYIIESTPNEEDVEKDFQDEANDFENSSENIIEAAFSQAEPPVKAENEIPISCTVHVDVTDAEMLQSLGITKLDVEESLESAEEEQEFVEEELRSEEYYSDEDGRPYEILDTDIDENDEKYIQTSMKKIPIISTGDGKFKCKLCPRTYTARGNLIRHHRLHTGEKRFRCALCGEKFFRKEYLERHLNKHSKPDFRKTKMIHSSRALKKSEQLPSMLGMYNEKVLKNNVADDTGKEELSMLPWRKSGRFKEPVKHDPEEGYAEKSKESFCLLTADGRYQCMVCSSAYTSRGNLLRHQRIHKGDFRFECDVCMKKFLRKEYLLRHMNKHTKVIPRKPRTSKPKVFEEYEKEIIDEDGKKTYQCTLCGKLFVTFSNMRRHIRIHTGETPYSCHVCQESFYRDDFLRRHIRKEHPDEE